MDRAAGSPEFRGSFEARPRQDRSHRCLASGQLELVGYLPEVWLADEVTRQLRRLVRFRVGVVAHKKDLKLRIQSLLCEERVSAPSGMSSWTKAWMEWIKSVTLGAGSGIATPGAGRRRFSRGRQAAGASHSGRCRGHKDQGATWSRYGDGGDASGRDRALTSLPHRQAVVTLLWCDTV